MDNKDLQVENGNFTRIVNPLIMELIKIPFKGCGLAIALCIIRKTYGYHKTRDSISLSQFTKDLCRSRNTIIAGLKELQDLNIVILISKGNNKGVCNVWAINKYYKTWLVQHTELVQQDELVQSNVKPSAVEGSNLVQHTAHTKEIITKEITKEIYSFEEFWLSYPKKVGKGKSLEIWKKIKDSDKIAIKEDIPKRLHDKKWLGGFIKDPERYLKHRQWEDEIQIDKNSLKVDNGKYNSIKKTII